MLNRHKRQYFCMIQNYVQQYINFALDTKNDHSAPKITNRLRYEKAEFQYGFGPQFPRDDINPSHLYRGLYTVWV